MSAERIIGNLLWLAQDDLDDAPRLSRDGKRNAAYHLEQAAEKALKAVLVSEVMRAGAGHQLEILATAGRLRGSGMIRTRHLLAAGVVLVLAGCSAAHLIARPTGGYDAIRFKETVTITGRV